MWTGPLGVDEVKSNSEEVKVWPNPSNGVFTVEQESEKENEVIEVYNELGEKVYSNELLARNYQFVIDLSSQPEGIYLYRILSGKGEALAAGKLIIQ